MSAPFEFTSQATEDLDAIWYFVAKTTATLLTGSKLKSSQVVTALQDSRSWEPSATT